ncbi:Zinc finger MYM-type protein 5, partial [Habropoda laboriosa]
KSKKLSGAQNKKRRLQREENEFKLAGSLNKFLTPTAKKQMDCLEEVSTSSASISTPTEYREHEEQTLQEDDKVDHFETSSQVDVKVISNFESDKSNFNFNDPGTWPKVMYIKIRDCSVENNPYQVKKDFPKDNSGRKFSELYYYRSLSNGEKICRSYLVYSETFNSVFCYYCKLFGECNSQLTNEYGCNDWEHLSHTLKRHELSSARIKNGSKYSKLKMSLNQKRTIDSIQQRLYETDKKYWQSIFERLIYIVQYLSRQCLAFRGFSKKTL